MVEKKEVAEIKEAAEIKVVEEDIVKNWENNLL